MATISERFVDFLLKINVSYYSCPENKISDAHALCGNLVSVRFRNKRYNYDILRDLEIRQNNPHRR